MIEMGKKYQTRDGRVVEILRTNVKNKDFPVVGIRTRRDGSEIQDRWTADGCYYGDCESEHDLMPAPTKHEGWMFVTIDGKPLNTIYLALEAARDWEASTWVCSRGFVFLSRVTWET